MTLEPALACLYLAAGGMVAPLLIPVLFARERAWGALGDVVLAFVVVIGTVLLWPTLLLLVMTDGERGR